MWLGLSVRVGEANGVASRRLPGRGGEHEFTAVNTYEEKKLKLEASETELRSLTSRLDFPEVIFFVELKEKYSDLKLSSSDVLILGTRNRVDDVRRARQCTSSESISAGRRAAALWSQWKAMS